LPNLFSKREEEEKREKKKEEREGRMKSRIL